MAEAGHLASSHSKVALHKTYSFPLPVRIFPLPSFYPNNPLSLLHLAYAWLRQVLLPPPSEPSIIHQGIWDTATQSVHVTDSKSIRAFWEQGFFGKGSLSRSEPNWLRREQIRRGLIRGNVSEQVTLVRREERIQAKWERARLEQEAIEQTRLAESKSKAAEQPNEPRNLTYPLVIGSAEEMRLASTGDIKVSVGDTNASLFASAKASGSGELLCAHPPCGPLELLALPNSKEDLEKLVPDKLIQPPLPNGLSEDISSTGTRTGTSPVRRRKSVRFSRQATAATYEVLDPPPPPHFNRNALDAGEEPATHSDVEIIATNQAPSRDLGIPQETVELVDKEHLQLSPEEAFFLVFAIGALVVVDPSTGSPIPTPDLLHLLRISSYLTASPTQPQVLSPHDPFLIRYAVYHHFRSLGWIPRHGIKFGVDWLLYQRGPVFDHAEFGILVLPSYSDPWWKEHGYEPPCKTWHMLHGVNRVMSHVLKSLILVYVDIPPPPVFNASMTVNGSTGGISMALREYRIREVMVRRWSANRNRS